MKRVGILICIIALLMPAPRLSALSGAAETPASLSARYALLAEPAQLRDALSAEGAARFIDLRDEKAFNRLHIPGFVNVPFEEEAVRALADGEGPIYLICATGFRSALAYNLLLEAGAPSVHAAVFGVAAYAEFAGIETMEGADVCQPCLLLQKEGLVP